MWRNIIQIVSSKIAAATFLPPEVVEVKHLRMRQFGVFSPKLSQAR